MYYYYPKHSDTLIPYYTCPKILASPFDYQWMGPKTAEWVADSVVPYQMPHLARL